MIFDDEAMLHHDEPIWRNDRRVGLITSGTWGYSANAAAGLGWAESSGEKIDSAWIKAGEWEVEVAGRRFPAQASLQSFYDPGSARVRA